MMTSSAHTGLGFIDWVKYMLDWNREGIMEEWMEREQEAVDNRYPRQRHEEMEYTVERIQITTPEGTRETFRGIIERTGFNNDKWKVYRYHDVWVEDDFKGRPKIKRNREQVAEINLEEGYFWRVLNKKKVTYSIDYTEEVGVVRQEVDGIPEVRRKKEYVWSDDGLEKEEQKLDIDTDRRLK